MRKKLAMALVIMLSVISLSGCETSKNNSSENVSTIGDISGNASDTASNANSGTASDTVFAPEIEGIVPVKEALSAMGDELATLKKNGDLENLDFTNALNYLPKNPGDMYELKVTDYPKRYSNTELYERFLDGVKKEFPNSKLAEDKEYYFFNSEKNHSYMGENHTEYPKIYEGDNLKKIKSGEFGEAPYYMYSTDYDGKRRDEDDEYLQMYLTGDVIMKHAKCRHAAKVYGEKDCILAAWMPRWSFAFTKSFTPDDETVYRLTGGDLAVNDAVKFCEDYFNSSTMYVTDKTSSLCVTKVKPLQIDENTYAYYMFLTNEYNGIPFAGMNFDGMASDYSDGNEYDFNASEALIFTPNEMEYCYLNCLNPEITKVGGKIENIIPLKKAAEIAAREMSKYVTLDVHETRLCYYRRQTKEDPYISTSRPVWQFTAYNTNDEFYYDIYVDVEDGSMFYFKHV